MVMLSAGSSAHSAEPLQEEQASRHFARQLPAACTAVFCEKKHQQTLPKQSHLAH